MTLLPRGVKVHLALGYTDMRKGIDGLAMLVQGVLRRIRSPAICSCSGGAPGLTSSRSFFGTGPGSVCLPSGSSTVCSCGPRASSLVRRCL